MKVTLIVGIVTAAALGVLYIVAQPTDTLASPSSHSLSKTTQSNPMHRAQSDL
jgi:hypothetical protein